MNSRPTSGGPGSAAVRIHGPGLGWVVDGVAYRYPGATGAAVSGVSTTFAPSTCTAVLGPNGSGKSTLLRLLLGMLKPRAGTIEFGGRPLNRWTRRDLARTIGVVPQGEEIAFPISVRELVQMGRYPHLGPLRPAGPVDHAAIESAMRRCDVLQFADRAVQTLSGGERQRARLARALAQEPSVLVLDEPTLALDVRHEMEIFELVRYLTREGATVLLATHNLNLAARYADSLLLLSGGGIAAAGPPADVMRVDLLEGVYGWPLQLTLHPGPGPDVGIPQVTPMARPLSESPSIPHVSLPEPIR